MFRVITAALVTAVVFCGTARACERCASGASAFERIDFHTETIRLGGRPAEVYAARGYMFYHIASSEKYKQYENAGLSSRKEAYDMAIADLSEALRLSADSKDPVTQKNYFKTLGSIHLSASNFDLAIAGYSEAIRLNPGDKADSDLWQPQVLSDGLYFARGAAYYITGAYGKAIEDFEAARRTRIADDEFLAETAIKFAKKRLAAKSKLPPEAEREFFRGLVYYNFHDTGNERYGLKYFEAALTLDSANAEYHRMLGLAYCRPANDMMIKLDGMLPAINRPLAVEHFLKAVRLAPSDAKNYAALARVDTTVKNYAQAVRLAPDVPEHRIGRASWHIREKEYGKALADYLEAVKSDSGVIYRARALQERSRYSEITSTGYSDKKFDTMLCAELKRVYSYGAELCGRNFTFGESARDEEKGPAPAPDTEEYHYNSAKEFTFIWNRDKAESAVAHYTELIRRFQRNAPYYAMRAVAYSRSQDNSAKARAVADYVKAVELDSSFLYWDWIEITRLYPRSNKVCYFIADIYTELLRKSPGNAEYHYQKGMTQGAPDSAIADFSRAIRLKPGEAAYHKALGDAYLRKGDCQKATESHLKAMRLDPKGIYFFLNPAGYPVKGYRAMLDKAIAGGGTVPAAECKKIADAMKKEWEERK
ncbi:MAG: tetratricopeptide repeat protein [Chitinispirillia bacterium]|nr:tetratricopeptide repeat protein [Chitinispirillia bacterium]